MKFYKAAPFFVAALCAMNCFSQVDAPTNTAIYPNIYGGVPTPNGQYQFMAALISNETLGPEMKDNQFCGGTLIHPYWILTAAHCVEGESVSSFRIAIGNSNLDAIDGSVRVIPIDEIHIHEQWDTDAILHDIALIKLSQPVFDIVPIKVNDNEGHNTPGMFARVAGWGLTNETTETIPNQLMQTDVPIVSIQEVDNSGVFGVPLHPGMLPTYSTGNVGNSCMGDSGGPLFVKNPDPLTDNQLQLGIVSFGDGNCDSGYSVYTRLSYYFDWIQQRLDNTIYGAASLSATGSLDAEDLFDDSRPGGNYYAQDFTIYTGQTSREYQFTLDTSFAATPFHPIISLLDGTTKTLLAQAGDHPQTVSIQAHLPVNSSYIIRVTSALPLETGQFSISSRVLQESNDQPAPSGPDSGQGSGPEANFLTPGSIINGAIDEGDVQHIEFEGELWELGWYDVWEIGNLTAGNHYRVQVAWNGSTAEDSEYGIIEPELLVYQRRSEEIVASDDYADNVLQLEFQARNNQSYNLQLGSFTTEATGSYQLTFSKID